MRYQRSFPNVIPHAKAGCSRVTHPSATKLPSSKLSSNSVRLECVMHAASVHPEPGSNSRINCIKITSSRSVSIFSSFYFQLLLLLFEQYSLSEFYEIFFRTILLLSLCTSSISCCSIFNDQFSLPKNIQLCYSITFFFTCQVLFLTFFKFFILYLASPKFATLLYYHILSPLSSGFLKVFSFFEIIFL